MSEINSFLNNQSVGVYLRLCPPRSKYTFIESISRDKKSIQIAKDFEIRNFKFDNIFIPTDKQLKVFMKTCTSVLKGVVNGLNGSIIAYGQTGSGKTFTILGETEKNIQGILQYSLAYLLSSNKNNLTLEISAVEIYMNNVFDIFSEDDKKVPFFYTTKKGTVVKSLVKYTIKHTKDLEEVLKTIFANRKTKKTRMNARSSRSHAIFRVKIYNPEFKGFNYLNIVDLAGSERVKKSQIVDAKTLEETISINTSLMALGKCINYLSRNNQNNNETSFTYKCHSDRSVDKQTNNSFFTKKDLFSHIPYRDSKLTMLLQNCLNGKSLLSLIVTISPDDFNVEESFSSLRFADSCMNLEIKPIRNKIQEKKNEKVEKQEKLPNFTKIEVDEKSLTKKNKKNNNDQNQNLSNKSQKAQNEKEQIRDKSLTKVEQKDFVSNQSVKNSEDNYFTNFTFQKNEEKNNQNFLTKGKSEKNEDISTHFENLINSEKNLINKNLNFEQQNFNLNHTVIFKENLFLKNQNEKLLREIEDIKFLQNEKISQEVQKNFFIEEKDFGDIWKKIDQFLFIDKITGEDKLKDICKNSKSKILLKNKKIENLTIRANVLEKISNCPYFDNLEDNVRAYFAVKKIVFFLKKSSRKKKEQKFNDFQKIKIQMGKSMLNKMFNINNKLLIQLNDLINI
jgi:hypothetical protein